MEDEALDLLAERLDDWARNAGISVTENGNRLAVRQLSGEQALELLRLLDAAALPVEEIRDAGGNLDRSDLDAGARNVQVRATLPDAPAGVERLLTLAAFEDALRRDVLPSRVWVRRLFVPFETMAMRYGPWGDGERQAPAAACADPRRVMRAIGAYNAVDADLCRWLLVDPDTFEPPPSPAFEVWRARAAPALARAVANEIDQDGTLVFRGPPLSRFALADAGLLEQAGFMTLQRAARWTYLNTHELEQRHALMSAEIARTSLRNGGLRDLGDAARHALDGAKIAYAFGITQQSRETLKALSDLRKAVMDEAARLSDITRGLVTAVGGAVFGGVGLLAVRLNMPSNGVFVGGAALLLGLVLILHVVGTIVTGALFIRQQKALREQWRSRLYAFLGDNEYRSLVIEPVDKAEFGFWVSAVTGGVLAALIFIASLMIYLSPPPVAPGPIGQPSAPVAQKKLAPVREIGPARPVMRPVSIASPRRTQRL
jgi:hypothetical protein